MSAEQPRWGKVAAFSPGMAEIPHLAALLGADEVRFRPSRYEASGFDAVVGWGNKPTAEPAIAYAREHDLPYWRVEDGFLRSVGLGRGGAAPLSVVLDDRGIYYDARTPSRLEAILAGDEPCSALLDDPAFLTRADRALQRILAARLSKYNDAPPRSVGELLGERVRKRVLVVDQTQGDLSITHGLADVERFGAMLDAAMCEHAEAEILVKVHPDVVAGHRRGCVPRVLNSARVRVLAEHVNPVELLREVDHVYVVTSQLGFEALLTRTPVTTFGAPFYAGWGLSDDRAAPERRTRKRTLVQAFAAAYLLYPRYLDPETGERGSIEQVIDHLSRQRAMFEENRGTIFCFGFRPWKRGYVRDYLRSPGNRVVFARSAAHAESQGCDEQTSALLVWGQRAREDVAALAERHALPVWRMEDGFLRSVGLGSDFVTPASLVVDKAGVYYDPRTPSALEKLLAEHAFSDAERERARALREAIVSAGVSKYNVGQRQPLAVPEGARVVLVPGQVEDDASIALGCPGICSNEDLLRAARVAAPDAHIVYKPHPDVLAGNRQGQVSDPVDRGLCDQLEDQASLADCLAAAHEVHTLTSLVGFEALLRGLPVTVHGQPFYAGWGLTADREPVPRRRRRLRLDELVAGALILYPRYLHPETHAFTTPEAILAALQRARAEHPESAPLKTPWPRRQLRKLGHIARGLLDAC
ncbi:capsular polysaccharide biosynthesis protein [Haliangium ochraceum]|uniref:Capsule polysaccharide biosynthesis protein n=1 Tax=Haliangium ochraceum (strain DSM 14365 / JCM 11303 / SMP-2) TaxID=502025 RepID=D0LJR6_HALO1|nr:capsular polysaccharide biosynthesis protein [Haliangium ochraceum]ACY18423.1 Capsule polysaccharide biosynthesis protein [Haliangium ochraceum DSM 14365]